MYTMHQHVKGPRLACHISSARCGAYGASSSTKGSSTARGGGPSHLNAPFTNSIMAAMPVLKRSASVSSVT